MGSCKKGGALEREPRYKVAMPDVDFISASTRHLEDSKSLLAQGRFDNALYLGGYATECALKAVVFLAGAEAEKFGHRLLALEEDGLALAFAIAPATVRYRPPVGVVRRIRDVWSETKRYDRTQAEALEKQARGLVENSEQVWRYCIGEMLLDGVLQEPR